MFNRVLMVSMLGLTCLVVPARATYSYYTDPGSFDTAAAGLTMSAVLDFTSPLIGTPGKFRISRSDDGNRILWVCREPNNKMGMALVGTTLQDGATLTPNDNAMRRSCCRRTYSRSALRCRPQPLLASARSASTPPAPLAAIKPSFLNPSTNTQFFGITSPTAFSTIWITGSGGSPELVLQSFQDGTQAGTPEVGTMLALGSGLTLLGLFRRRLQRFGS